MHESPVGNVEVLGVAAPEGRRPGGRDVAAELPAGVEIPLAQVIKPAPTPEALVARDRHLHGDPVALRHSVARRGQVAHLGDRSNELVAEDKRERGAPVAPEEVLVRAADPAELDPHQQVARPDVGQRQALEVDLAGSGRHRRQRPALRHSPSHLAARLLPA
jgi:hypothetical protein